MKRTLYCYHHDIPTAVRYSVVFDFYQTVRVAPVRYEVSSLKGPWSIMQQRLVSLHTDYVLGQPFLFLIRARALTLCERFYSYICFHQFTFVSKFDWGATTCLTTRLVQVRTRDVVSGHCGCTIIPVHKFFTWQHNLLFELYSFIVKQLTQ